VFLANAGSAKSEGVELAINAKPIDGLTLSAWTSWDDAILTSSFPATASAVGIDGDRLPYSSKFSANLSALEEFPITGQLSGLLGGQVSYVGDRFGDFVASSFAGVRPELPGYAKVDVRGGVRYGTWTVNLYANNVADRRGVISVNPTIANPTIYIQPRTMGLSLVKTF
jgi:iron complex outermembrane receptor protein